MQDTISLGIDNSKWTAATKKIRVSGTCETDPSYSYSLKWQISTPISRQGNLPIACANGAFGVDIDLSSVTLPNGNYKVVTILSAQDSKSGDIFETDPETIQFQISPPPLTNACSSASVNAFCSAGAVPPDRSALVRELALRYPAELSRCDRRDADEFVKIVIRELRLTDPRWGSNWVRGVIGDSNGDVISYYYGDGAPQENSPLNVIVDIVVACGGDNESVSWGVYSPERNACCNPDGSTKWTIAPLSR